MSPRPIKLQTEKLMSVRMISEELGLPERSARSIAGVVAREFGEVRFPGNRRVWLRRADVERVLQRVGARGEGS